MLTGKTLRALTLTGIILSSGVCRPSADAHGDNQELNSLQALLQLMANQPDHMADWTVVINAEFIGATLTRRFKIARKQGKTRREFYPYENEKRLKPGIAKSYKIFIITQPERTPLAFDPQAKTFAEVTRGAQSAPFDVESFLKNASKAANAINVEDAGTMNIGGHQAMKIRLIFEGEKDEIFLYFAKDLKNLFIGMGSNNPKQSSLTLSNISFDVPDDLFEPPTGYKKVDSTSFERGIEQNLVK